MSYFIVGTAGHIDHGKTTLVKSLTGIDTDRLKEEKLRGITIETGYAFLKIPEDNITIGFIDVPGHEKFIKNMVSGIYGIDILMLVIAADESIMPQTVEHLEICKLLGIKKGFIVVTKIDLVDDEMLELIKEELKDFTKNTFLENSPVFFVSATTNRSIEELKNYLISLAKNYSQEKPVSSIYRLPIDRVFTLKGFGTVVTGTSISGKIKVGDNVIIYPEQINSKVRNIHVHNTPQEQAIAGQRTALNLQGVEKEDIKRGSIVTEPGFFNLKNFVYAKIDFLSSNKKPLNNRTTVKFHIHTDIIPAKINLLNRKNISPGEECFSMFSLSNPTIAINGDRFIIRSFDDRFTLGGGVVLLALEKREKISSEFLEKFYSDTSKIKIEAFIEFRNYSITTKKDILANFTISFDNFNEVITELKTEKKIVEIDNNEFIHSRYLNHLKSQILELIKEFHNKNPHLFGILKEELKSKIKPEIDLKLFNYAVSDLINNKKIEVEDKNLKLKDFKIKIDDTQTKIIEKIYNEIKDGGVRPPVFKEISAKLNIEEKTLTQYLNILLKDGKIEKVSPEIYFEKKLFEKIKNDLINFLNKHNEITVKDFKNIVNTSRKYLIPLLEYFDKLKVTVRVGDKRILRK